MLRSFRAAFRLEAPTVGRQATVEDTVEIKIDIISDTMCPWCWVGKRHLEIALKACPKIKAEIDWLPFFLDKKLPEQGKPVRDYYRGNYGDPRAGERMQPHLEAAGEKLGLDFKTCYSKLTHYWPTLRSHRLIELAKRQGKQDEMVEALFHMYFATGKPLNSIEHLAEAARIAAVEGAEDYLKSKEDEDDVLRRAKEVQPMAQGVPTFIFRRADRPGSKPMRFSGGQPVEAFMQVFKHLSNGD